MNRNTLRHLFGRQRKRQSVLVPRLRRHTLPFRFHGQLEDLEQRQLLAADILASEDIAIRDSNSSVEVAMDVTLHAAAPDETATLVINSLSAGNGLLDPRALEVRGSDGAAITPLETMTNGSTGESSVYALAEGSYTIVVGSDNGTSGVAALSVLLAGSAVTADGIVSQGELILTAAAHAQAQGGGNFNTEALWQSLGIDTSVDLYDVGMDTNGNGTIDSADLAAAVANSEVGHVEVQLSDASGPTFSGIQLTSDTGIGDDQITTDPTVEGVIADESEIASFSVILDDGTETDLSPFVGDVNADPNFQISLADWDVIAGGALTDDVHTVTFVAEDSIGNRSTSDPLTFSFIRTNEDPLLEAADSIALTGELFQMFADNDGLSDPNAPPDVFTLDVIALDDQGQETSLPGWMSFTLDRLFGIPSVADVGVTTLRATLTDSQGGSDTEEFTVTVVDSSAPVIDPLQLKNDTGVSSTDGITTDPTVTGRVTVTDDNTITNLSATLDDGTPVDLPDLVAGVNDDGNFELTASDLDTVAGGALTEGAHTLSVTVTDSGGLATTSDPINFHLIVDNVPPEDTNPVGDQTATQDQFYTKDLSGTFTDSDPGDPLTLELEAVDPFGVILPDLPGWMSFDEVTGIVSGTPAHFEVATHTLRLTATDSQGASSSTDFGLTVENVNDPPLLIPIADQTTAANAPFSHAFGNSIAEFDNPEILTISAAMTNGDPLPSWLSLEVSDPFDPNDPAQRIAVLSGTPASADVGDLEIRVTVTDLAGASAESDFTLTVTANAAPVLQEISDQTAVEDSLFEFDISNLASDDDPADVITFAATLADDNPLPDWLSFSTVGVFMGTPTEADAGTWDIRVTISDPQGATDVAEFAITVGDADVPVISDVQLKNDTGVSATDGITTDPTVTGTVTDSDAFTGFTASLDGGAAVALPHLVTAINADPHFELSASDLDAIAGDALTEGSHTLSITITDENGSIGISQPLSFVYIADNGAPTVTNPVGDQTATEDELFSLDLSNAYSDPNAPADVLTLGVATADGDGTLPLPSWLNFNDQTGQLVGTPGNADVGLLTLRLTATDSQGASSSTDFDLTVENVNDPPLVSPIADQTATQDVAFSIDLNNFVSDQDVGDTVTLSATLDGGEDLPDWLSLTAGVLFGTPANADVDSLTIRLTATDVAMDSDSETFQLTVENVNDPPELVSLIPNQIATQDALFSLDPRFAFDDPDGDALTYSAQLEGGGDLPDWLDLDPSTGILSGTPTNGDVDELLVQLSASDVEFSVSDLFVLTVENVNDPPTLVSDIPDSVATVDGLFSLDLSSFFEDVDADDSLAYAAEIDGGSALPAWLGIDPDTGELSGTPAIGDITTGMDIRVTATDESDATASDLFSLAVSAENSNPVAEDDDGFLANHQSYVAIPLAELLANDMDSDGDTLTPTVDVVSNLGATISVLSGHVIYDPSSSSTLGALTSGQSEIDTFEYTVSDGQGGTDTATVSVAVSGEDNQVEFTFNFTDVSGGDVSQVTVGQDFHLEIYAAELPTPGDVVFSAYLDVVYGGADVQITDNLEFNTIAYVFAANGDTTVGGLINEVGAVDGISVTPASGPTLLVTVPMRATTEGTIRFVGDAADELPLHEVSRFDGDGPVPLDEIQFESANLEVVAPLAAAVMLEDVNGDGAVSPVDAMLVVQALDEVTAAAAPRAVAVSLDTSVVVSQSVPVESGLRLDVNGDGHVSPVDALMVVRALDQQSSNGMSSNSMTNIDRALAEESSAEHSLDGGDGSVPTYAVDLLARSTQDADPTDDDDDRRADADAALDALWADWEITE